MLTTYRVQQEHFPNIYARRLLETVHALAESVENHTHLSKQVTQSKHLSSHATVTQPTICEAPEKRHGTCEKLEISKTWWTKFNEFCEGRHKRHAQGPRGQRHDTPLRNDLVLLKAGDQPSW